MSARGLCLECGEKARYANIEQLVSHSGPYFDHWRVRCLASFGVALIDEPHGGR